MTQGFLLWAVGLAPPKMLPKPRSKPDDLSKARYASQKNGGCWGVRIERESANPIFWVGIEKAYV